MQTIQVQVSKHLFFNFRLHPISTVYSASAFCTDFVQAAQTAHNTLLERPTFQVHREAEGLPLRNSLR